MSLFVGFCHFSLVEGDFTGLANLSEADFSATWLGIWEINTNFFYLLWYNSILNSKSNHENESHHQKSYYEWALKL